MGNAYIRSLTHSTRHQDGAIESRRISLEARFRAWFDNLPPESQRRPFSMSEMESALKSQGRHISALLVQHGWQRKRVWSTQRYCRYWLPPVQKEFNTGT